MIILRIGSLALISLILSLSVSGGTRIDPAGIAGTFILSSEEKNKDAIEEFVKIAGKEAKILILNLDATAKANDQKQDLIDKMPDAKVVGLTDDHFKSELKEANAVWLVGQNPKNFKTLTELEAFRSFLKRSTIVGAGGQLIEAFGSPFSDLFPDAHILTGDTESIKHEDGKVLYKMGNGSALVLSNRSIRSIGQGKIIVTLKQSKSKAEKKIHLNKSSRGADLTALRFAAVDRKSPPFPARVLSPPKVKNGSLIIIGGGPMPRMVVNKFIQLAGGDEASIVVLPTAVPDSMVPRSSAIADTFKKFGPKEVTVLPGRKINEVDSEKYLDVLKRATGIWFGGGRQWNFVDAYHDTKALKLMHQVLDKGGVIMGSSAGASIQAEYLVRGNPLGNRDMMADGYEKGLGFLKGVAIDQHFAERNRFKDLSSVIETFPQLLGIGIDEGTALIVKGPVGLVQGKGQVHFYDRKKINKPDTKDYESVGRGGRYQLVQRKVLNTGKITPNKEKKE